MDLMDNQYQDSALYRGVLPPPYTREAPLFGQKLISNFRHAAKTNQTETQSPERSPFRCRHDTTPARYFSHLNHKTSQNASYRFKDDLMQLLYSATLPIVLTNNNDGQTRHFGKSAQLRKSFERYMRASGMVRKPFEVPVTVHVTRLIGTGQRLWDSSSGLRGNYKEIEDAAVACGWFHDDGPKYITETRFFQRIDRANGPAVMIEVFAASDLT